MTELSESFPFPNNIDKTLPKGYSQTLNGEINPGMEREQDTREEIRLYKVTEIIQGKGGQ